MESQKIKDIEELQKIAKKIRKGIIEEVYSSQSGHPGGSLSIADILTVLYFYEMNINPENPKDENRDRLVLSKGHCSPALYATLANRGFFDVEELKSFRNINGKLQGHPDMKNIPGVDMTTGSLGQGLSDANGMAIAGKLDNKDYRVYCILGDGEIEEGQIWEAAMASNKYKLDNDIYMRRCPYEKISVYDSCPVRYRLFLQGKHRSPETGRFSARYRKKPWKDPPVPQPQRRFLFWDKKRKERTGPHGVGCLYLGGSGHSDMVTVPGRRQKDRSARLCPHHGGWFK